MEFSQHVKIQEAPIDTAALQSELPRKGDFGGYVTFEGVVRSFNMGKEVSSIHYTAYESMAYKVIAEIIEKAQRQHQVGWVRLIHRIGPLALGESAVAVVCLARHRREAFECCMQIMDELKKSAPIWKKEYYTDSTHSWPRCQHH